MTDTIFSDIENRIINEIMLARKSIKIAVAWFNLQSILNILELKAKGGIAVTIILNHDEINDNSNSLNFSTFKKDGGTLIWAQNKYSTMHEKFCIIDDEVLLHGTYNWTNRAEKKNDEHLCIHKEEPQIVGQFCGRFEELREKYSLPKQEKVKKQTPQVTSHPKEQKKGSHLKMINTPYAFIQLGKGLTLLQLRVLLKVSEQIQDYLNLFYRSGRNQSKDDTICLFDAKTLQDIPTLKIPYSDFCVPINNRAALYNAIKGILCLSVPTHSNGIDCTRWPNVLSLIEVENNSISGRNYRNGYLELKINSDAAAYAFNMKLGYINHPVTLAVSSKQVHAPHLYFLIKHRLISGREVTIKYEDLREELGLNPPSFNEKDSPNPLPTIRPYPKFSDFKKNVLDAAVADINRMFNHNQLDIKIDYHVNYRVGITRGNPDSITFSVSKNSHSTKTQKGTS